jgi:hydrogenase maturation factor HypE
MDSDKFKLLGLLPGLYFIRDEIQNQINTIEQQIEITIAAKDIITVKKIGKNSNQMKKVWASYTPEQREARIKKIKAARKKALNKRRRILNETLKS